MHVLQIADQRGRTQVIAAGRDQRLMHVQRDRTRAVDPCERVAAARRPRAGVGVRAKRVLDQTLVAGDVRQSINVFR